MPVEWRSNRDILALPLPRDGKKYELHPDAEQAGLYVRVTQHGVRAFVVDKHVRGTRIRPKLGPAGAHEMTPAQARQKARIVLGLIAEGYGTEQILERLARSESRIPAGAPTLGQILEQCLAERQHKLSPRTVADYRSLVNSYLSDWKDRPLESIDEDSVVARFTSIDSHRRADYCFQMLRMVFNYAAAIRKDGKPLVSSNPVKVLSHRRLWHNDSPPRGVIKPTELKAWWKAVKGLKTDATYDNVEAFRDWVVFMLLTGLRRTEAAELPWKNVDLAAKMFTIPQTKNRVPHTLPLSDYLYAMLKRRHAAMLKQKEPRSEFVFAGHDGQPISEPQKLLAKTIEAGGVYFSPQTLRRTFETVAESLDIPFLALKRLLNHKFKDVTYIHYTVISVERLRKPMQKITDFMLRAAGERKSAAVVKVTPIRKSALAGSR